MLNTANGELTVIETSWASKEELFQSSFSKEEQIQRAYDNLVKAWTNEKRAQRERERRDWGDERFYKD